MKHDYDAEGSHHDRSLNAQCLLRANCVHPFELKVVDNKASKYLSFIDLGCYLT